jgi:hypothetical protein
MVHPICNGAKKYLATRPQCIVVKCGQLKTRTQLIIEPRLHYVLAAKNGGTVSLQSEIQFRTAMAPSGCIK